MTSNDGFFIYRNDCYVLRFGLLAHAVLQCCQLPLRCVIYKKLKVVRSGMSISPANILASRIRDLERERAWELNQVFAIFVYLNCSILAATTVYHTFWAQTEDTGGLLRACWFLIFCFFSRICGTFIWSWLYFSRQQLMGATSKELQELNCRCFEQDDSTVSCVICMMDFSSSEEVCALPCSDKHIFHSSCVRKWLKVSKLCPLCMKPIAGPKAKYK